MLFEGRIKPPVKGKPRMKIKTIFIAIGVIAIISILTLSFELVALLLPLFIGLFILIKFGKDDVAKYIGFLSLKPVFSVLLLFLESKYDLVDKLKAFYSYEVARDVLWVVPELTLTLVIVYSFRYLFMNNKLVRLFLIVDIVRWLSVFVVFLLPNPYPEPYFYWQAYLGIFFIFMFPSLYALGGLIAINKWANSQTITY